MTKFRQLPALGPKRIPLPQLVSPASSDAPVEFIFSTGEELLVEAGEPLSGRLLTGVTRHLCDQVRRALDRVDTDRGDGEKTPLPRGFAKATREQVAGLSRCGLRMRFIVSLGSDMIGWNSMLGWANPGFVYPNLWRPGYEKNSYTLEELEGSETGWTVKGLLINAQKPSWGDAALFLTRHSWDSMYCCKGLIPQKQAIGELTAAQPFGRLVVEQTSHRDATTAFLSDSAFCAQGSMRVLGRRSVGDGSAVGDVRSGGGQWELSWSYGGGGPVFGVGLSAGLPA